MRVGKLISFEITIKPNKELRRVERLNLARDRHVEDEDELIGGSPVFVRESFRVRVIRPVKLRDALACAVRHPQTHRAEMRKLALRLITRA